MENDNNLDSLTTNLIVIRRSGMGIDANVIDLSHKLIVPLEKKDITLLKENALSAKRYIENLENFMLSLKEPLEDLHQSNDEERKYLAEAALEILTSLITSVSIIADIVEEGDNLTLESSQCLMECLESMKTANKLMKSKIDQIPINMSIANFKKKCIEHYLSTHGSIF